MKQNIRKSWNEFNKNHGHSNSEWEEQLKWFISNLNTTLKEIKNEIGDDISQEEIDDDLISNFGARANQKIGINEERQRIKQLIHQKLI